MAGSRDEVVRFVYSTSGDKDLANTAGLMVKMADAGKLSDEETVALTESLKKLAEQSAQVNKALSDKAGLAETATRLQEAKDKVAALNAEFDRTDTSSKKITAAFAAADKAVEELTKQQNLQQVSLTKTQGSLQKAGIDTTNLAAASRKLAEEGAQVAPQLVAAGNAASSAAKGTQELGDRSEKATGLLGELRDNLGKIVSVAAAVELALKGIEFGKEQFEGAADVEQSLARVRAVAQSTAEEFAQLGDQIEKSAIAANVSTTQSAAAAAALAEQGQTAAEIFQTLTPTLLLARDAQIEVADAAGIVDDALDLFGKNAGDAALVVDQLVFAAKGSKDGITGLATAIRTLAPDARQMGLSFEQLVGLLGLMSQNGIDAEKATRGLRTVFQDLQDPGSKLSLTLARLGDSSGNFSKAIETLRNAGQRGQDALLGLDGSARSLVLFLLQQAPGAVDAFTAALAKARGEASKTAKVIDETLHGAFTSFKNSIDRLGEGVLKTSLGPLQTELQKLADQLTEFATSPAFAKLEGEVSALFKQAVEGFDKVVQNIHWDEVVSGATDAVGKVGKAARDIGNDAKAIADSINDIATAIAKINAASDALSGGAKAAFGGTLKTITEGAKLAGEGIDAVTGKTSAYTQAVTALDKSATDVATGGFRQFADGAKKLTGAAEESAGKVDALGDSLKNVQAGAQTVDHASDIATAGFDAVTGSVENAATALDILPELFGADAAATNVATAAHNAHAEAITNARKAVDEARASLVKLAQSGDQNSEAFTQASNALKTAEAELDRLTGKADDAAESQRALSQAFKDLHITSQAELEQAASDAARNLETIRQAFVAGKATVEDTQRAFAAYAATVKASVADSSAAAQQQAQAQVDAQASALGLKTILIETGKAGEDAGKRTAEAYVSAKDAIAGTADATKDLAQSTAAAAIAQDRIGESAKSNAAAMGSVIALTIDQTAALGHLTEVMERQGGVQNLSLQEAKNLLESLGAAAGVQAQVLTARINELEQAAQRAEETAQRMKDEASSIQDEIDQITGNDADIEDRRHAQKLADLKAEAEAEGVQNTAAYRHLVDLENQLHDLKEKNLRDEAKNAGSGNSNSNSDSGSASSGPSSGGGTGLTTHDAPNNPNTAPGFSSKQPPTWNLNVTVNGPVIGPSLAQLGEELARIVKPALDRIALSSR